MLAVVDLPRAGTDPGSVALGLLRCFSTDGPDVLFIDANPMGTRLADRFGEAIGFAFRPDAFGLPTLVAAGADDLAHTAIRQHCYRLDNRGAAPSWLMFAPSNTRGAAQTVTWLNDHAETLESLEPHFRVVVASSLKRVGADAPMDVLARAARLVAVAPAATDDDRAALADPFAGTDLPDSAAQRRMLLVEGDPKQGDGALGRSSPLEYLGRLPDVPDARLLMPPRRVRRQLRGLAAAIEGGRRLPKNPEPAGAAKRPKPGRTAKRPEPSETSERPKPAKPSRRSRPSKARGGAEAPAAGRPPPVQPSRRARRRSPRAEPEAGTGQDRGDSPPAESDENQEV